ncbi:MAG: L-aspartate oxidase [Phycisphaerales bacterium JB050]
MHALPGQRRYLIPFRTTLLPQIFTDTLVIGAGAAGLSAARVAAQQGEVIVLAKGKLDQSNTAWAQGGIAGVLDKADSPDLHAEDTLNAGAGLCDEAAVRYICESGTEALRSLIKLGFDADRTPDGRLELAQEGGHSTRRIVHADGDATGTELSRALAAALSPSPETRVFTECFVLDLLTASDTPGSPCLGAITYHRKFGLQVIWATTTILASGGCGTVWRESSNPPGATGDGLAIAYRAGATLADMAFMQFHPTTLYIAGAERLLVSEAVRGEGAYLLDASMNRFMVGVHPMAELAPRDVVASAIYNTLRTSAGSHVWLDARHLTEFRDRFPGIHARLAEFDLDPSRDLIPVNPAAHYMVGGVHTDLDGRTSVPHLLAVGEVASTGLHGANRLASNSLLEAIVMGEAAGRVAAEAAAEHPHNGTPRKPFKIVSDVPTSKRGELDLSDVRSSLRSAMWRNVGIERNGSALDDVSEMCEFWSRYTLDKVFDEPFGWETQNMLQLSSVIVDSARDREESRGCHRRRDFPHLSEDGPRHDLRSRFDEVPRWVEQLQTPANSKPTESVLPA